MAPARLVSVPLVKRVHVVVIAAILGALLLVVIALANGHQANLTTGTANTGTEGDINWPPILAIAAAVGGAIWLGIRSW